LATWVGLHFGPFFHKLIWSPWLQWPLFGKQASFQSYAFEGSYQETRIAQLRSAVGTPTLLDLYSSRCQGCKNELDQKLRSWRLEKNTS
jgi:hypothetical protein